MLDSVLTLLDRCSQLIDRRKARREELYKGVIQPIYEALERVHDGYLKCFENYRRMIAESSDLTPSSPVFDQVLKDHIFTQHMRAKLKMLANRPRPRPRPAPDALDAMLGGIYKYLETTTALSSCLCWEQVAPRRVVLFTLNKSRSRLLQGLKEIAYGGASSADIGQFAPRDNVVVVCSTPVERKTQALAVVDKVVEDMQWQFNYITENYLELRPKP